MARPSIWQTSAAVVAAGLLAAACSSSGGSGGSGGGTTANSPAPAANSSKSVVVDVRSGPLGKYLTDGKGLALYMFASDTSTSSSCAGPCIGYWPPFDGAAKAGNGVTKGELGSISTGGKKQVTYNGHPLYYYAGDTNPGQTGGQGLTDFGAAWWLLTPSGKPITATSKTAGTPKASKSSSGGGPAYP